MAFQRASGLLLHPTSLPGGQGVGDFGAAAYAFVDFLAEARQQYWQVLPLGPTGFGDSPYQTFSAFAGNPLLIDLARLAESGWLDADVLASAPENKDFVDFGAVVAFKLKALRTAYVGFNERAKASEREALAAFAEREADWLEDYALFASLKDHHGGASWDHWWDNLRTRDAAALEEKRSELADDLGFVRFVQWCFDEQWARLKAYANERGVKIIGDIPIFVAFDSADAWASPELYFFDESCRPTVVAGVPPDYFSETGQLWGNPLYRWDAMAETGFAWWKARMRKALALYDVVRIDHFRGFEAYWEVPAGEPTAINGRWVKGPGAALFEALSAEFGPDLPIIAEDLGLITPEVEALRDQFGLPGMKILQFAFGDPANAYLPHHFVPNSVVYTGTHDNDTSRGWYQSAPEAEKSYALDYMGASPEAFTWSLIRLALGSVSVLAVFPVQDLLDLGSEARMNTPSVASGNWGWRLLPDELERWHARRLAQLTHAYGRTPETGHVKPPHGADELEVESA